MSSHESHRPTRPNEVPRGRGPTFFVEVGYLWFVGPSNRTYPAVVNLRVPESDGTRSPYIVSTFWDCNCGGGDPYIHRKSETRVCPKCGAREEDQPDAHLNEVFVAGLLAPGEAVVLITMGSQVLSQDAHALWQEFLGTTGVPA